MPAQARAREPHYESAPVVLRGPLHEVDETTENVIASRADESAQLASPIAGASDDVEEVRLVLVADGGDGDGPFENFEADLRAHHGRHHANPLRRGEARRCAEPRWHLPPDHPYERVAVAHCHARTSAGHRPEPQADDIDAIAPD
jgi:hypothetical protein